MKEIEVHRECLCVALRRALDSKLLRQVVRIVHKLHQAHMLLVHQTGRLRTRDVDVMAAQLAPLEPIPTGIQGRSGIQKGAPGVACGIGVSAHALCIDGQCV